MDQQEYQGRMEDQLGMLGKRIDQMAAEAKDTAGEMRQEYNQNLEALRAQRDDVQKKLNELKHTSGRAWDDMKNGVDKAWDDVQQSMKKATSRFQ